MYCSRRSTLSRHDSVNQMILWQAASRKGGEEGKALLKARLDA
jgi:hypothetical protein